MLFSATWQLLLFGYCDLDLIVTIRLQRIGSCACQTWCQLTVVAKCTIHNVMLSFVVRKDP